MQLAPSILSADLAHLAGAAEICEKGGADLIHFDVMDGHFVPNLTFGIPVLAALAKCTRLPIDVHLMVANPGRLIDDYLKAGASWISVHWEATAHLDGLLGQIRAGGAKAGVAINPATPVEPLANVLHQLDFVVLMSVNPGFSGQRFLPHVLDKARTLRQLIDQSRYDVSIEIDGGIGPDNIRRAALAGVDICVAGSATFAAPDPIQALERMRRNAEQDEV